VICHSAADAAMRHRLHDPIGETAFADFASGCREERGAGDRNRRKRQVTRNGGLL